MTVFSTGLPALDQVLQGIRPGDNIAWQVDEVRDYIPFIDSFVGHAIACHEPVIYFRFAHDKPPIANAPGLIVETLEGLKYLHSKGIIHGNIKPEYVQNISLKSY